MAPRTKTSENVEGGEAPRRSSRIASIPAPEVVAKPAPARKASSSKKRPADEAEEGKADASTSKKTKADAVAEKVDGAEVQEPAAGLEPIDIGDSLPSLTLKNEKGEDVQVAELAAEKGVVFFLVPKADTPGCTTQACAFRDVYPDFSSHNVEVYCLSADTSAAQSKWQLKKELPYPLLSDPKRILITALGAAEGGKTKRSHFIFAKGGKLLDKKIPVKPADSPTLALEFIKSLEATA
ncbi:thioredoxin-like protein [Ephemerocybe angulata]|uniref:thioredoxin-dependent peroxiredoxin n=1 Tax=Ephemerocybe angulata TaxID=980116 RepID=A0A8H6IA88_9AGAR|nr:thioredoxin-like protein [Tulosesus angulatus]